MVRFVAGADDEGEALDAAVDALRTAGHEVELLPQDQWPDVAARVAGAVASGAADQGLLFCWTGTGTAMAANKVPGVRAALVAEPTAAKLSRQHNDANVICFGERLIGPAVAEEALRVWLEAPFEGGRHAARVAQLGELDQKR